MNGIITNEERLKELKDINKRLIDKKRGRCIAPFWMFWKDQENEEIFELSKKILEVFEEIRIIKNTIERAEYEKSLKKRVKIK